MNRHDRRSSAARKAPRQSPRTLWTAGLALVVVVLLIARLNGAGSPAYTKVVIGLAAAFLLLRQIRRRSGDGPSKASEPDPLSRLNLD